MSLEGGAFEPGLSRDEKARIFGNMSFANFNGLRFREVVKNNREFRVEHKFDYVPSLDKLSILIAWSMGVGGIYLSSRKPDSTYLYLKANGSGEVSFYVLCEPEENDALVQTDKTS